MLFNLLQSTVPADTAELNKIESAARETIEHIATTPIDELLPELMKEVINFGIKVLIALLIYFIGAWLIKKIRKMLHRLFEKRNTEKAIASFVESLTSIALMVILVIITVGTLGINTTSLAALLAGQGQIQFPRGGDGIVVEHLVKVTDAIKQDLVFVLVLDLKILLHHGRKIRHGNSPFLPSFCAAGLWLVTALCKENAARRAQPRFGL